VEPRLRDGRELARARNRSPHLHGGRADRPDCLPQVIVRRPLG
jgi:hypothetical protein